jgi:hypothetical protein
MKTCSRRRCASSEKGLNRLDIKILLMLIIDVRKAMSRKNQGY